MDAGKNTLIVPKQIAVGGLGLAPSACLVIEDSVNGIVAARAAGCFSAGLTTSFSEASLREAGADIVVSAFSELKTALTTKETDQVGTPFPKSVSK